MKKQINRWYLNNKWGCYIDEFVDGEPTVIFENIIELQDSIEKQEFNFQTKLVNYDSYCIPFTLLKMEILDVYKGTDFDDTAISEIEVFGEYITNEDY